MSTSHPISELAAPSLSRELRGRPSLMLYELSWRWTCGGFLLLLAGLAAWRIYLQSLPVLDATGVLKISVATAMADPMQVLAGFDTVVRAVWPQIERDCWGLAPLAAFCWVGAFAWGRTAVLARYDPGLPRRPWMLAKGEAVLLAISLFTLGMWSALSECLVRLLTGGGMLNLVCFALSLAGVGMAIAYMPRCRRVAVIATALALMHELRFRAAFRRAWALDTGERVLVLRKAVRRVRWMVFGLAAALTFVPAPFGLGWPLLAWWTLLSLPTLIAADAWKLGATLAVIQTFRERGTVFPERARL